MGEGGVKAVAPQPSAAQQVAVHFTSVQPSIDVRDLVKRYKGAESNAVDGISFTVAPGEFFALLGPNGAGKTTTISILTTTLAPSSGTAIVAGHDLRSEASTVRRNIGIIFQKPSLDMNLTAEENVRFHAILYGLYPFRPTFSNHAARLQERVQDLARVLDIQKEIFQQVRTFSGGMKRKLEIVRSLIHTPRVLFLDEPTSGLDPLSRRNLWEYLATVRHEYGTTVFLTTHYLEEAEQADRSASSITARSSPAARRMRSKQSWLRSTCWSMRPTATALRAELRSLGIAFSETPEIRIHLNGHSAGGRSTHDIVRSITTPLTVAEDAYTVTRRRIP